MARGDDPEIWWRGIRSSSGVHRQPVRAAIARSVFRSTRARIPGADSGDSRAVGWFRRTKKHGSSWTLAEPVPGNRGGRFFRQSYARARPGIAGTGEFAARSHGHNRQNQTKRIQEPNLGHEAKTGCGSLRVGLADSKIHRPEGAICVCTRRSGASASRPVRYVSRAWFRSSGRGLHF